MGEYEMARDAILAERERWVSHQEAEERERTGGGEGEGKGDGSGEGEGKGKEGDGRESAAFTRIDSVFFSQVNPCKVPVKTAWAADSEDSEGPRDWLVPYT